LVYALLHAILMSKRFVTYTFMDMCTGCLAMNGSGKIINAHIHLEKH
jgi:hypothetical protein